jgi:replicative DNA helicase
MTAKPADRVRASELALLHCLVTVPACWWRIAGKIEARHIGSAQLRRLFEIVGEAVERDSAADVIAVMEAADADGEASRKAVRESTEYFATVANVEHYAAAVRDAATRRDLQAAGHAIAQAAQESSTAAEAMSEAQQALSAVMTAQTARWVGAKEGMKQVAAELMRRYRGEASSGLPTGFADLDALIELEPGRVYGIGARPKIGKSVLACNIAHHLTMKLGKWGGIWTGEMPVREYYERITAHHANIGLSDLKKPSGMAEEDFSKLLRGIEEVMDARFFVTDDTDVTIESIEAQARFLHARGELDYLVIDYLGLLKLPKADRHDLAIGHISRRCKIIAKELKIPVILVFQLNRASETGAAVRLPRPSDARDSGNIEQDLDVMLLLHRWSAYDQTAEPGLRLEVALNRNGPTGLVKLGDRLSTASFVSLYHGVAPDDPFWTRGGASSKPAQRGGM